MPVGTSVETALVETEAQIRESADKVYTESELKKLRKAELVVIAQSISVDVTPDSETNEQIITKILTKQDGGSN